MMQYTEGKIEKLKITCQRCGMESVMNARQLYRKTEMTKLCRSCTAKPAVRVARNGLLCFPHQGEIDLDTLAPLDKNGNLYLPGHRICGSKDCCTKAHIVPLTPKNPKGPFALLDGKTISFEQFLELEEKRKVNN
jgi:hypothetical protein